MLRKIINKAKYLIESKKRKNSTKNILKELENSDDSDIKKIASTLNFIIADSDWSNKEKMQLKKVDQLNKTYLESSETIETVDYGSGTGDSNKNKTLQKEGLKIKQKVSDIHKIASSKEKWGELIFKIIRDFKPDNCLELGTSLGISASYQILALQLNGKGKLTSIEGSKERAEIADENLKKFQTHNYKVLTGKFVDVLPKVLTKNELIDFAFIDGHHDKAATQEYFELLYPYLTEKSILIFDDINWSNGMKEVWKSICDDNRVNTSIGLNNWGICLVNKENNEKTKNHFKLGI